MCMTENLYIKYYQMSACSIIQIRSDHLNRDTWGRERKWELGWTLGERRLCWERAFQTNAWAKPEAENRRKCSGPDKNPENVNEWSQRQCRKGREGSKTAGKTPRTCLECWGKLWQVHEHECDFTRAVFGKSTSGHFVEHEHILRLVSLQHNVARPEALDWKPSRCCHTSVPSHTAVCQLPNLGRSRWPWFFSSIKWNSDTTCVMDIVVALTAGDNWLKHLIQYLAHGRISVNGSFSHC